MEFDGKCFDVNTNDNCMVNVAYGLFMPKAGIKLILSVSHYIECIFQGILYYDKECLLQVPQKTLFVSWNYLQRKRKKGGLTQHVTYFPRKAFFDEVCLSSLALRSIPVPK